MIQHANISIVGIHQTYATKYKIGNLDIDKILYICATFKFDIHVQYQDSEGKIGSEIIRLGMNDLVSLFQKEGYEFKVPEHQESQQNNSVPRILEVKKDKKSKSELKEFKQGKRAFEVK